MIGRAAWLIDEAFPPLLDASRELMDTVVFVAVVVTEVGMLATELVSSKSKESEAACGVSAVARVCLARASTLRGSPMRLIFGAGGPIELCFSDS